MQNNSEKMSSNRRMTSGIPKFNLVNNSYKSGDSNNKSPMDIDDRLHRLIERISETTQKNIDLEKENMELKDDKIKQVLEVSVMKEQFNKLQKTIEKEVMHNQQLIKNVNENQREIEKLKTQLDMKQESYDNLLYSNKKIMKRLAEIDPHLETNQENSGIFSNDIEIKINTYVNSTDLQLYEAREKMIELLDNKNHLEEENARLKQENSRLLDVGHLMTENMKETLDNNQLMEERIVALNNQQIEMARKSYDGPDGPVNNTIAHLEAAIENSKKKTEIHLQIEEAIEKDSNEKIKILELKLGMMENELKLANIRAEQAELDLNKLKQTIINNNNVNNNDNTIQISGHTTTTIIAPPSLPPPPPPPPPPLPILSTIQTNKINKKSVIRDQQQVDKATATGLDAIVNEIKDGKVTLRKRNRMSSSKQSPVLKEMFELLEKSRKQNRNSKVILEIQINPVLIEKTF